MRIFGNTRHERRTNRISENSLRARRRKPRQYLAVLSGSIAGKPFVATPARKASAVRLQKFHQGNSTRFHPWTCPAAADAHYRRRLRPSSPVATVGGLLFKRQCRKTGANMRANPLKALIIGSLKRLIFQSGGSAVALNLVADGFTGLTQV